MPRQVRNTSEYLADFQRLLQNDLGFELEWQKYGRITPRLGTEMKYVIRELRRRE